MGKEKYKNLKFYIRKTFKSTDINKNKTKQKKQTKKTFLSDQRLQCKGIPLHFYV